MKFEKHFPNLQSDGYKITSPADVHYNCVAWAAGESNRWWEPAAHWPGDVSRTHTLDSFLSVFKSLGYEQCENRLSETGKEKIALFANDGDITHAARQLPDGRWTSKLGMNVDIEHSLEGLEGGVYGEVIQAMSRAIG
ncbi:MAG: hypothetical protein QF473_08745 [Planctomycetota bacterium]|jgi:hypothetical protein|nr:hypothetical protein [Planctomycetota bacterium]MDP6505516.1 hypothetical protein [Planctomycetota bacterium]